MWVLFLPAFCTRLSTLLHHLETEGVIGVEEGLDSERMKSEMMDFCAGVNLPYHSIEMGISPWSKAPLWYARRVGGGWYRELSFLEP